jgi:hypothetical protein
MSGERMRALRGGDEFGRRPPGIWLSSYNEDIAAEICERLAGGESLRSICREDVTMPTEKTVWNWALAHPEFAAHKAWALARARKKALEAQRLADASRRLAKDRARIARGFRPMPPFKTGYSEDLAEAICLRLVDGESLTEVCRDKAMPSIATVYLWLRRYPDFVRSYRLARQMQAELLADRAMDAAMAAGGFRAGRRVLKATDRRMAQLAPKRYA